AHWQLRDLRTSGTIVGGLSAWATAGALVGTFGTGFLLVPLLPVSTSVLAVAILLVLAGVLLGAYTHVLGARTIASAILSTAALGVLGPSLHSPCDTETSYHCVQIKDLAGGDAFSGLTIPWQLMTVEWLKEVRRVLKPDGLYALNIIDLRPLALLRAELATLLKVFSNVRMVTPAGEDGRPAGDNAILFA